jgi:hypothetical protein
VVSPAAEGRALLSFAAVTAFFLATWFFLYAAGRQS